MPPARLAIDGLWRCLCPSFDTAILSVPLAISSNQPRHRFRQCSNSNVDARPRTSISTGARRRIAFGPRAKSQNAPSPNALTEVDAVSIEQQHVGGSIKRKIQLPTEISVSESPSLTSPISHIYKDAETPSISNTFLRPKKGAHISEALGPNNESALASVHVQVPHRRNDVWQNRIQHLSVEELHDLLRQACNGDGGYENTMQVVQHLLQDRKEKPTLLYYDALIRANADPHFGSAAMVGTLLEDMTQHGFEGNKWLYHSCLQALAVHPDYTLRAQVLRDMKSRWYDLTVEGWHNLVVGLLKDRQYEIALEKLEQMHAESIKVAPWLYDIIIYLFCEAEELDEALRILQYRVDSGDLDISANIWYFMLDSCSSNYHYQGTLYIWQRRISTSQLNPSDGTLSNILSLAARYSDSALATDVVRVLSSRAAKLDVHHYEALLAAFAGSSDLTTAFRILSIMKKARLEPSEGSVRPIYAYLTSKSLTTDPKTPQEAYSVIEGLYKEGHPIPIAAINVVLSATLQLDSLAKAMDYYRSLMQLCPDGPSTATFDILLGGCAKAEQDTKSAAPHVSPQISSSPGEEAVSMSAGQADSQSSPMAAKATAMFLVSEMVALNIRASELTYDRLILVCLSEPHGPGVSSTTNGYEDAMLYLDEMRTMFGFHPKQNHLSDPGYNQDALANQSKCAPLRMGTWSAIVKRAAKRGDERTWDLLVEMELLGLKTRNLRAVVENIFAERETSNDVDAGMEERG